MTHRLGSRLRATALALLLGLCVCAPVVLLSPAPASALLVDPGGGPGGTSCQSGNNGPAAAGTSCNNGGTNSNSTCKDIESNVPVCDVRTLGNGLEFFALVCCVAGIFVSAILWAVGSRGQNPGQELTGKRGLILCLAAAFVVGMYPSLTTFFAGKAGQTDNTGVTTATVPPIVEPGGSSAAGSSAAGGPGTSAS